MNPYKALNVALGVMVIAGIYVYWLRQMNNIVAITIILGAAFALSMIISFLSGRIWRWALIPLCCWIIYLLMSSLYANGWRFDEGLGLPLAFAFALLILVGVPMVIISVFGALLGSTLSKRAKSKKITTNLN